ncbi:hypothetical protein L596_010224 [Steinernema carpocapsae]|uniref:G-protein coupled receptors family 1 profile domain-containing protein n=1 Tax=Steinernema carpocapsae TaxID=34508 RepID=A0A4U5PI60_STECR|nr:hypothetical protein L596_010224 [Steinernema carpocapsae]
MKVTYMVTKSRIQMHKRIAWTVFLQSILPSFISLPLLSFLVVKAYGTAWSDLVLWFCNASMFIYFAVSPIITVMAIKKYRLATKQLFIGLLRKTRIF